MKALLLADVDRLKELSKALERRPGYHRLAAAQRYLEAAEKVFPDGFPGR